MPPDMQPVELHLDYAEYGKAYLSNGATGDWRELAATPAMAGTAAQLYAQLQVRQPVGTSTHPEAFVDRPGNFSTGLLTASQPLGALFVAFQVQRERLADAPGADPDRALGRRFHQVRFIYLPLKLVRQLFLDGLTPYNALLHQHGIEAGQSTRFQLRQVASSEPKPVVLQVYPPGQPYATNSPGRTASLLLKLNEQQQAVVDLLSTLFLRFMDQPHQSLTILNTKAWSLQLRLLICEALQYLLMPLDTVISFTLDCFSTRPANLRFVHPTGPCAQEAKPNTVIDPANIRLNEIEQNLRDRLLQATFANAQWAEVHALWQQRIQQFRR